VIHQKTISKKVLLSGIGVHTGSKTTMTFFPAPVGQGIEFVRVDLPNHPVIKAEIENVVHTARGTILGKGNARIHTVEHVMAALWAFGITNLRIELDAEEPPVGDGSSLPFVQMLEESGVEDQKAPGAYFKVSDPIIVTEGETMITVLPYEGFRISYTLSFNHPLVNTQYVSLDLNKTEDFVQNISACRTFCFYREVELLMDQGLIRGGSLDNAVVIGDEAILSKEGLRFEDEFARHKILDILGDLYLTGVRLEGHLIAVKSGHSLNVKLATAIKKQLLKHASTSSSASSSSGQASKFYKTALSSDEIKEVLPHRYPFLLVDKITEITETGAKGIKNVTANEDFFNGHFPGQAIMPGVLQIEAMAQVAGASYLGSHNLKSKHAVLLGIEKAKFRRPVRPGDQLKIEITFGKFRSKVGKASGVAKVNEQVVSEAEFIFGIMDIE
jgi:UDP-3-O-[3-hydroxymyristoyl] N-acetylglucosamine deacetylase/3-hydroxyacyl-[acyl-carrier-protein] dehydratase